MLVSEAIFLENIDEESMEVFSSYTLHITRAPWNRRFTPRGRGDFFIIT